MKSWVLALAFLGMLGSGCSQKSESSEASHRVAPVSPVHDEKPVPNPNPEPAQQVLPSCPGLTQKNPKAIEIAKCLFASAFLNKNNPDIEKMRAELIADGFNDNTTLTKDNAAAVFTGGSYVDGQLDYTYVLTANFQKTDKTAGPKPSSATSMKVIGAVIEIKSGATAGTATFLRVFGDDLLK